MTEGEKVRLGGMALPNGVLVHGPRNWACAVRSESGELLVASGLKPIRSAEIGNALVRGPARFAEIFALLPTIRRRLPDARLPFERPWVIATMVASAYTVKRLRRSRLGFVAREGIASLLSLAPAVLAVRGTSLAEYHGAEHIAIGTYDHGEPRTREHERCGTHLVGPMLAASAVGGALAAKAPPELRPLARTAAAVGAVAASVEIFGWMLRHADNPLAKALARPGHELQQRFVTAEPSSDQLAVAEAALAECLRLELEGPAAHGSGR
jgi:uncharacterized protein YqhQ